MTRFTLFFASLLLQSIPNLNSRQSGQISTHCLLWWVRHTFPTDLTYFQLCLLFSNAFFFLSFPLFLLYLSLHPCCFNCWVFCFQKSVFGFFSPLELLFSPLCTWKEANCESILTHIQKQFMWMRTMFENFWNLETNTCSLNTLYTFEKRQIWCLLLPSWIHW